MSDARSALSNILRAGPHVSLAASALGLLTLVTGIAWWWLIYSQVVSNAYMSYSQAAPCLLGTSDLCNLAQVLCKGDHFLGIRHYSPMLFWAGIALAGFGLVAALPARRR